MIISIELTETQYKGLEYVTLSPEDWVTNIVSERARIAIDEIVQHIVQHCLNNGIQIPGTREEIVKYGFDNEIIKILKQKNTEIINGIQ